MIKKNKGDSASRTREPKQAVHCHSNPLLVDGKAVEKNRLKTWSEHVEAQANTKVSLHENGKSCREPLIPTHPKHQD
jgi:hypothetical protein